MPNPTSLDPQIERASSTSSMESQGSRSDVPSGIGSEHSSISSSAGNPAPAPGVKRGWLPWLVGSIWSLATSPFRWVGRKCSNIYQYFFPTVAQKREQLAALRNVVQSNSVSMKVDIMELLALYDKLPGSVKKGLESTWAASGYNRENFREYLLRPEYSSKVKDCIDQVSTRLKPLPNPEPPEKK